MNDNKPILVQLSPNDGRQEYELLQRIGSDENAFTNPVHGKTFEEFKEWLIQQDLWSRGKDLPAGYVGQTCYWLKKNELVIGFGKIRHALTEQSRKKGGNIGYAIAPEYRGKGYGNVLLSLLIQKADELGIKEKMLTVEKYNWPSARVIEKNGGVLFHENEYRWFYKI